MAYKLTKDNFHAPTPTKWRRLGNALLATSAAAAASLGMFVEFDYKTETIIGIVILGGIGKFLSEFFSEDPQD